jgi:hypothetical protein
MLRGNTVNEGTGTGRGVIDVIAHSLEDNTSRRVFGEPVTLGEVTVIPAARVIGRGGGGLGGGAHGGRRGAAGYSGTAGARVAGPGTGGPAGGPAGGGPGRTGPDEVPRTGEGSGVGLTQSARPVGAFVVNGNDVSWRPAIDLNRIVLGGQLVAVAALLVARSVLNHRRHRGPSLRAGLGARLRTGGGRRARRAARRAIAGKARGRR